MKRLSRQVPALWVAVLMILFFAVAPHALYASSAGMDEGNVGFRVSAVIPENQIDTSLSYFDLRMKPSDTQTLEIEVFNDEDREITVEVALISASTNRNGLIDYRTPDIRDETLRFPFSELASTQNSAVSVPAKGEAKIHVDVQMPKEEFNGVVLGGIVVTRKSDEARAETGAEPSGGVISNSYSYTIGVKLSETDVEIKPAFELFNVTADTVNYRAALVHYLRNSEAAIVKGMNVKGTVARADSGEVVLEDAWTIDMAPNSVIELPGYTTLAVLQPGDYESTLTLTSTGAAEKEPIVLRFAFTIEGGQVRDMEKVIPREQAPIPLWAWLLIGLMGLLVILAFILIIILLKRRKKERDDTYARAVQAPRNEDAQETIFIDRHDGDE